MKHTHTALFILSFLLIAGVSCTKYRDVPNKGAAFVAPAAGTIAFGSLRINEFMCKGTDAGAMTHFNGSTSKWFELYNPTSQDITLDANKWFVTDDLTSKTKFSVPTSTTGTQWTVPAGGFIAVICVKSDGSTTPAPGKINANFSLSSSTGAIGLFYQANPSASVLAVDTVVYDFGTSGASSGVSYGRKPDGQGSATNQLSKVTPEASNN